MTVKSHLCVIDLESLSLWNDAVILSLGLSFGELTTTVPSFDQLVADGLYIKFDVKEQIQEFKRSVKPDTMTWWKEQGESAKYVLYPSANDVSVRALDGLVKDFFKTKGVDPKSVDIYDRRSFDCSKIEHLYKENLGLDELPWHYLKEYEVSTALRYMGYNRYGGISPKDYPQMVYHNALHDSVLDHIRLQKCMIETGMLS